MVVVLSEDTLLTKAHITRLNFLNIAVVYIKDEYELSKNYQTASSIFNRGNAFVKEYDSVVQEARSIFDETSQSGNVPINETQDMVKDTRKTLNNKLCPVCGSNHISKVSFMCSKCRAKQREKEI